MKRLTTYKREVERTEKLGLEYQTALNNIITEIKKDDNLSPTKILDIVGSIQEIKRNRKRWAAGTGDTAKLDIKEVARDRHKYNYVNIPNITFTPRIIIAIGTLTEGDAVKENLVMININFSSLDNKFGCFILAQGHNMREFFSTLPTSGTSSVPSWAKWSTEKWIAIE